MDVSDDNLPITINLANTPNRLHSDQKSKLLIDRTLDFLTNVPKRAEIYIKSRLKKRLFLQPNNKTQFLRDH